MGWDGVSGCWGWGRGFRGGSGGRSVLEGHLKAPKLEHEDCCFYGCEQIGVKVRQSVSNLR